MPSTIPLRGPRIAVDHQISHYQWAEPPLQVFSIRHGQYIKPNLVNLFGAGGRWAVYKTKPCKPFRGGPQGPVLVYKSKLCKLFPAGMPAGDAHHGSAGHRRPGAAIRGVTAAPPRRAGRHRTGSRPAGPGPPHGASILITGGTSRARPPPGIKGFMETPRRPPTRSSGVVRSSILPFQGSDPGFKSAR